MYTEYYDSTLVHIYKHKIPDQHIIPVALELIYFLISFLPVYLPKHQAATANAPDFSSVLSY